MPENPDDSNMLIARAKALEEYALLESALAQLLSTLLGTTAQKASIVFFAIFNSRSRNQILETLLEVAHKNQYDTYWYGEPGSLGKPKTGGLFTLIHQLNEERNRIVHWHPVQKIDGGKSSFELMPPKFWHRGPARASITVDTLTEFKNKANFVYRSVNMFYLFTTPEFSVPDDARDTWRDIFGRPAIYPPSNTHPLACKRRQCS